MQCLKHHEDDARSIHMLDSEDLAEFIIEGLGMIVNITYNMEGDGQHVFNDGASVGGFVAFYHDGQVYNLPSANRLIDQHVTWVNEHGYCPSLDPII
jgi:hypothetical protein